MANPRGRWRKNSRYGDAHFSGNFTGAMNVEYWSSTGRACATNRKKAIKIGRHWLRMWKLDSAYSFLKCRLKAMDYDCELVRHGNK